MTATLRPSPNWSLKEDIRAHWSQRAATFDEAFGHRIPPGPEHEAWAAALRRALGPEPLHVLELASGTGEITRVLRGLGYRVTGLDFSEAMLRQAKAKHRDDPGVRFLLGDAENTLEPDGAYDAAVCRHLVWTLTDPAAALRDWARVLKPGGRLVIFDGDFVNLPLRGRLARRALDWLEAWTGAAPHRDPTLAAEHAEILGRLPFRDGLTFGTLQTLAERAGFQEIAFASYASIARAQRRGAQAPDWLYDRFILTARRP